MLPSVGIITLLLAGFSYAQDPNQCSTIPSFVPSNHWDEPVTNFPFTEAGLQIFTEYVIPCNGHITQWQFISKGNTVNGLHLAVFTAKNAALTVFNLVSQTYVDGVGTPDNRNGSWVYYTVSPPMQVRQGDFLGMFYDRWTTLSDYLPIVSKNKISANIAVPPTVVVLKDARDMAKNITVVIRPQDRNYRQPALAAIVQYVVPTTTTAATTQTTTTVGATTKRTRKPPARTTTTTTEAPVTMAILPNKQAVVPPARSIPGRCLNPPSTTWYCVGLANRAYFDYNQGVCKIFYGCNSMISDANNFATMDECKSLCENYYNKQS